jgi:hypothetical protein
VRRQRVAAVVQVAPVGVARVREQQQTAGTRSDAPGRGRGKLRARPPRVQRRFHGAGAPMRAAPTREDDLTYLPIMAVFPGGRSTR